MAQHALPALTSNDFQTGRKKRPLTHAETRVSKWIKDNHGILSRLAAEFKLSVTFIQRIAYGREAKSKDMRVEKRLKSLGCPLPQKIE